MAMGTSCAINYAFLYIGLLEIQELTTDFGYSAEEEKSVIANCPASCGLCGEDGEDERDHEHTPHKGLQEEELAQHRHLARAIVGRRVRHEVVGALGVLRLGFIEIGPQRSKSSSLLLKRFIGIAHTN